MRRGQAYPVAAVLLAAGSSRRFGPHNKLLAEIGGVPLVRRVADVLIGCALGEIVVVTGPDADRVRATLDGLHVRFVHNADYAAGMGGSIAAGIRAVSAGMSGALICPGDMPALSGELIAQLIDAFSARGGTCIVHPAAADGGQRNPVLWPRTLFGELAALRGEGGGKALIARHRGIAAPIPARDDASFADIDTVEDLERYARSRP